MMTRSYLILMISIVNFMSRRTNMICYVLDNQSSQKGVYKLYIYVIVRFFILTSYPCDKIRSDYIFILTLIMLKHMALLGVLVTYLNLRQKNNINS